MKKNIVFLLTALLSAAASAAGLDVRGEMSFFAEVYPKNSTVTMLVIKGKMRTHLTGLMGEPVLNHQIRLDPFTSVFVRLPDGRIRNVAELTPEIQKAAQKIRFTLVGSLILGSRSPQYHMKTFIPFDSGASVSPGEGTSFNVPGSPAWGRLVRSELCGESFLDEKTARDIAAGFEKKDFWLATADMCSDKLVVDDSALREAIGKACTVKGKGEGVPEWCPKRPVKDEKPAKDEKAAKAEPGDSAGKAAKDAKSGDKTTKPGKPSALDALDKQEVARTAPPPPPTPVVKAPEAKPLNAPATPAAPADTPAATGGKVIFAEDFKVPKGWQGRYEAIESPGCAHLGAAHAGIHMAFSPGGPIWRDVSGFTPGKTYEISFEVRTLDPSDASKATFLVDDQVLHTIRSNGKVAVKFTASQATHRIKFDWKAQRITMAPVHVANLKITTVDGAKETAGSDLQRYAGRWTYKSYYGWHGYFVIAYVNGKLRITDFTKVRERVSWEVKQHPEIVDGKMVFTLRGINQRSDQSERILDYRFEINPSGIAGKRVLFTNNDYRYGRTDTLDFKKEQ